MISDEKIAQLELEVDDYIDNAEPDATVKTADLLELIESYKVVKRALQAFQANYNTPIAPRSTNRDEGLYHS